MFRQPFDFAGIGAYNAALSTAPPG